MLLDHVPEGPVLNQLLGGQNGVGEGVGVPGPQPGLDGPPLEAEPVAGQHGVLHDLLRDGAQELVGRRVLVDGIVNHII